MSKNEEYTIIYEIIAEHLSWVDAKLIEDLSSFIEDKLAEEAVITKDGKKIFIGFSETPSKNKRHIRTFIKKFLYKNDLKDRLRVTSTGKTQYTISKLPGIEIRRF